MSLNPLQSPPTNNRAEQALLGALLANNRAYEAVAPFLRAEHFADGLHASIYAAIAAKCDAGRLADAVTLAAEAPSWADEGTPAEEVAAYLGQLLIAMVGLHGAAEYGRAIHECWLRRELIGICEECHAAAMAGSRGTAMEALQAAENALFALAETNRVADAVTPAHEAMGAAIADAVANRDQPGGIIGLRTGIGALDEFTGGLRPGQFVLLGGRPSMGKTSIGLSIAAGAAMQGNRVLFVSREMTAKALGAQMVAGLAPVQRDGATRGKIRRQDEVGRYDYRPINDGEISRMVRAQAAMVERYLLIDECRAGTLAAVRARAMREKRRGGLDLIVLDYLGLFRVPELARSDNRTLEVTRLSEQTKALARDLGVPVVMLSQLNRGTEGREDKRPTMADLRDSGSLEQDADLIGLLYREHYYLSRNEPAAAAFRDEAQFSAARDRWTADVLRSRGRAELLIPKQREGRVGKIDLAFSDETTWFSDLEASQ